MRGSHVWSHCLQGNVGIGGMRVVFKSSEAAGKECCRRCAACGGESAADGVQLVGEAAEAVMSGLCILILIMVMRQIHRIYCSGAGDL